MKKTEHQIVKFESKFLTKKLSYLYDRLEKTHFMLLFILIELVQFHKKTKYQIPMNFLTSQLNCDIRTIKKGLVILETEYDILIYNEVQTNSIIERMDEEMSIYIQNINYLKKIKKLFVDYKNKEGNDVKIVPGYKISEILRYIRLLNVNNSEFVDYISYKADNMNYLEILLLIDKEIKCIVEKKAILKLKSNKRTKKFSIEFQENIVEQFGLLESTENISDSRSPYLIIFREFPVIQRILIVFILEVLDFLKLNNNKEYDIPAKLSPIFENDVYEIIIKLEYIKNMINYDISHLRKALYEIENGNVKDNRIFKFHYSEIKGFVTIQVIQPLIVKLIAKGIDFFE